MNLEKAKMKIKCQPFFGRDPQTGFRIMLYLDAYALEYIKPWKCDNGLFCARGTTPEEAVQKLQNHIRFLRRHKDEPYRQKVRA